MTEATTEDRNFEEVLVRRVSFHIALILVIFAAVLIVAAGYAMYWYSADRKYDIARPGEQQENKALNVEDDEADTTSPVDTKSAQKKLDYLKQEIKALNGMSGFNENALSNETLQLTSNE